MRKSKTLEEVMPIYKVEQDCILSRQGDITLGFEVTLPEIFTLGNQDFETLHQTWVKAIRLLPVNSIFHKQDWFLECNYQADFSKEDLTFLARSSERFFNERPYLDHRCYLYITQKPKGRRSSSALFSALTKPSLAPIQTLDPKLKELFIDKTGQFAKILQDSGYVSLRRLRDDELASTPEKPGLIEQYCYLLHPQEKPVIRDIEIIPSLKVGDLHCQVFSLADAEDMPSLCGPRITYEKYSTDKTKFSVSFAAPLGQMLNCNHVYNQYIIIEDSRETVKKMESKRLRLQSLSAYSRENSMSKQATDSFLNEFISQQRLPVKGHFNVITWSKNPAKASEDRNAVSAAMAQMDAQTRQETSCAAQLFFAGIPGNAADLPLHESFDTFVEQASCFLNQETTYQSSVSPVGLRLGDRLHGYPVHVDLSLTPKAKGIIQNFNKFILGPSGSGKSFFTCAFIRSYVEQGAHAVIVDVGHSYRGLCDLLEGYYFTYTEKDPIEFNPFFLGEDELDTEKKERNVFQV
jgi:conjugation system TraG family ATPase